MKTKLAVNARSLSELSDISFSVERSDVLKFLRSLPDQSIDLVVTDPAYSGMNQYLSLGRGRIVGKYADRGAKDGKWFSEFHDTTENYQSFLSECRRVLRQDRHIFIMFDSYSMLSLGGLVRKFFDVKNIIVWDKINIGMGHYFRRRSELILFSSKGKRPVTSRGIPDVWRVRRIHSAAYPTQKPVELFRAMIAASTLPDPNFVVCDPFCGSGSSAVAALQHGCSFIGSDISETAVSFTMQRAKAILQKKTDPLQPTKAWLGDDPTWW